jgi:NAD(P)-dependent dehydrogenase (short-subunit alcohol dehydrogenase family)
MAQELDFTGKSVLLTGASRGIGRACALMFAAHGAKVAVHYHSNQAAADETLSQLEGSGHVIVQADIADADAVKRMVDQSAEQLGGLDVLVNNAGIYSEHLVVEVSYEAWQSDWQRILQTNLVGAANAIFCAVPHLQQRGGGHIVNVSSRGAFRGEPAGPAYGASKAGMNSMGQSLAVALAPHNISVATVAPGWVATDMATDHLTPEQAAVVNQQSPLGRIATPEEVAYAVLFFASPGASFMTGAILDVNGASYLRT